MVLEFEPYSEPEEATLPTKRLRWATQLKKGKAARSKRVSIIDRLHHRNSTHTGEKRHSGADSLGTNFGGTGEELVTGAEEANKDPEDPSGQGPRKVLFNIPLPPSARDEDGHPLRHYKRNKVRTAKYTPISFIPKNLWLQFHNIANVYFLVLIILTVGVLIPSWIAVDLSRYFQSLVLQTLDSTQSL